MYLIAYDVIDNKRRYRVRKIAYSYAFGGQKSAVEALLDKKEVYELARKLSAKIDLSEDRVHIVKVRKFIYLGVAKELKFDNGDIIIN
ncbi:CRISPR-associated endonuclease Cas2 [Caminibacter profundus]